MLNTTKNDLGIFVMRKLVSRRPDLTKEEVRQILGYMCNKLMRGGDEEFEYARDVSTPERCAEFSD